MSAPASLYKYFSPERADVFENTLIRFAPLSAFNDPFEGRPFISGIAPPEKLEAKIDELLPEEINRSYDELTLENPELRVFSREQIFELFLKFKKPLLDQVMANDGPKVLDLVRSIPDRLDRELGALCLTESWNHILMWAHYTSSHTGFVAEFDTKNRFFNDRRSDKDEFRHLRKVIYQQSRPTCAFTEFDGPEFFLIKSEDWSYENEWRLIKSLSDANEIRGSIHLFSFPPQAVRSITLGIRSDPKLEVFFKSLRKTHHGYEGLRLFRAVADEKQFLILRQELTTQD